MPGKIFHFHGPQLIKYRSCIISYKQYHHHVTQIYVSYKPRRQRHRHCASVCVYVVWTSFSGEWALKSHVDTTRIRKAFSSRWKFSRRVWWAGGFQLIFGKTIYVWFFTSSMRYAQKNRFLRSSSYLLPSQSWGYNISSYRRKYGQMNGGSTPKSLILLSLTWNDSSNRIWRPSRGFSS